MSHQYSTSPNSLLLNRSWRLSRLVAATFLLSSVVPAAAVHAQTANAGALAPAVVKSGDGSTPTGPASKPRVWTETPAPATGPMRHLTDTYYGSVSAMKKRLAKLLAQQEAEKKKHEALLKLGKATPTEDDEEAAAAQAAGKHHVADGDDDDDGPGYLGAILQMTQMRAFPKDRIDGSAYGRAIAHRAIMSAASAPGTPSSGGAKTASVPTIGSGGGSVGASNLTGTTAKWAFVGPHNLPPPYTTYYGPPASILTGRVNGLAYDPNRLGTAYLAAPGGGIWKTTDSGATWTVLSDGPQFTQLQTSSVAVTPSTSIGNVVLAGMGDFDGESGFGFSAGIMRSTDGGVTWTAATSTTNTPLAGLSFSSIKFDPDNATIVTATSGRGEGPGRIWRSVNAGLTWTPASAPGGDWSALSIGTLDATGNRAYYAALQLDGIYKSTNRGVTWTRTNLFLPLNDGVGLPGGVGLEVATSKVDPNTAYVVDAALVDYALGDGRVYKTTTGGTSWVDITGNYFDGAAYNELGQLLQTPGANWSQCWYDLHATSAAIPSGKTSLDALYVGGITLSGATSNYSAWQDIGQTEILDNAITHSDQHSMAISPANGATALFGNDGGVYGLTYVPSLNYWSTLPNGGQVLNKTLGLTQIYKADFAPNNPSVVITGTQDNASPAAIGDLGNWINPGAGDGGGCAINTKNISIQYNTVYNLDIIHTNSLWSSSDDITYYNNAGVAWDGDPTPFTPTISVGGVNPYLLYAGTDHVWMWNENTRTWTEHIAGTQFSPDGLVTAIASSLQGDILYVGTSDGKLWIVNNASAVNASGASTAKAIEIDTPTGGNPLYTSPLAISSISVNPHNAYDILVGLSGTGTLQHLMRCADTSGAPNITFTNASGGSNGNAMTAALPDISLNDVCHDPADPAQSWYVATDIGVFSTINGGTTWQNMTEPLGLPNVQCNVIKAAAGYLNCATYGRGLWRISLNEAAPVLGAKVGISRSNGVIVLTLLISNTGGSDATNVSIPAANLTVNGRTTAANALPVVIGPVSAGQSTTVTVTFPGTIGTSGSLATISGSISSDAGTTSLPLTTLRLP